MIAMSIAERRNITPAVKLNEQLKSSTCSAADRGGTGKSNKYFMDMNSRKLPPPLVFYSESEKDAWIKNRNEQFRLDKVLDHLHIQEHVYEQIFNKSSSVVRTRSQKFQERARARITAMGTLHGAETGSHESEMLDEKRSQSRLGSAYSGGSNDPKDYISFRIETRRGVIHKNVPKPGSAWSDTEGAADTRGFLEMIADDSGDSDTDSLAVSDGHLSSTGSLCRPFSAIGAHRLKTTHEAAKRRVASAFPVSKLPKVHNNETSNSSHKRIASGNPMQEGRGRRTNKPTIYSPSRAEEQLKKELREMRKKRQENNIKTFDFADALGKERVNYTKTEGEIKDFYTRVNEMKKRPLSKWELKSIEARLKLW